MNKRIISMIIAGVIAVTALPVVSASAAEVVNNNNIVSQSGRTPYQHIGTAKVLRKAYIYTRPTTSSDTFNDNYYSKGEKVEVYYAGVDGWYAVIIPGGYGYIKASKVEVQ